MPMSRGASNPVLVLEKHGLEMVESHRDAHKVWVFIVVLYLPWCRSLESTGGIKPQVCADNLKRVCSNSDALLDAAHFSNRNIIAVGQVVASTECFVLSTCASVRSCMKSWVISGYDDHWKVDLDVRDCGGHLDTTLRGQAVNLTGNSESCCCWCTTSGL